MTVTTLEPWLTKAELAQHLGCCVRFLEYRITDGLPSAIIAGRRKFKVSEAEAWLEAEGHILRGV